MNRDKPASPPAHRIYQRLLALYPGSFCRRYGDEMERDFIATWNRLGRSGNAERRRFIGSLSADLIRSVPYEWWAASTGSDRTIIALNLVLGPLFIFIQPGTLAVTLFLIVWLLIARLSARVIRGRKFGPRWLPILLGVGGFCLGFASAHLISWHHELRDQDQGSFRNALYFVSAVATFWGLTIAPRTKRGFNFRDLWPILGVSLSCVLPAGSSGMPSRLLFYGAYTLMSFRTVGLRIQAINSRSDLSGPSSPPV